MSYIYDVLANFSNVPYDFFEWNKGDNIYHLKKTPIIKIHPDTLYNLLYHKVKINDELLRKIKNNTEIYGKVEIPNYISVFTDGKTNACVKFNGLGINVNKSYLPSEEDEEALDLSEKLDITNIEYKLLSSKYKPIFKTRREIQINSYILKNIKYLDQNNDIDKLMYIYYDCFDKKESNKKIILNKIYKELLSDNNKISTKLYELFRLLSVKNN